MRVDCVDCGRRRTYVSGCKSVIAEGKSATGERQVITSLIERMRIARRVRIHIFDVKLKWSFVGLREARRPLTGYFQ